MNKKKKGRVAYQGVAGAYSHLAARQILPTLQAYGVPTFEHVVYEVRQGHALFGLLPIENSTAGRVADVHQLLPNSQLSIVGEHFLPIHHSLISSKEGQISSIKRVFSHPQALAQCSTFIKALGLESIPFNDTADSVRYISEQQNPEMAAIASPFSTEIYKNTKVIRENIQNQLSNVTRFLLVKVAKEEDWATENVITSIAYSVRNVPAALYKSLAGFATSGVNILKLESFVPMANPTEASFYLEFEGRPDTPENRAALEELGYYSKECNILGAYKMSTYRDTLLKVRDPKKRARSK